MPARQKPDRFAVVVRTVFGRWVSARKIEALPRIDPRGHDRAR
jgi:hypothetical protein